MASKNIGVVALGEIRQIKSGPTSHVYPDLEQPVSEILWVNVVGCVVRNICNHGPFRVEEFNDEFVAFCWWMLSCIIVEPLSLM